MVKKCTMFLKYLVKYLYVIDHLYFKFIFEIRVERGGIQCLIYTLFDSTRLNYEIVDVTGQSVSKKTTWRQKKSGDEWRSVKENP